MATTASLSAFSTISAPVTESGTTTAMSTNLSTDSNVLTNTTSPFGNNNANPSPDPVSSGPSVYLYGFLAILVFIFAVSIAVAWKGYHTRRVLRARLDEAIARGTYIPGETFGGGAQDRFQHLKTPIMYHNFLDKTLGDKDDLIVTPGWGIKPTAIATIQPYTPPSPSPNGPRSPPFRDLLQSLREYWFARAPEGIVPGEQSQTDGRPTNSRAQPTTTTTGNNPDMEVDVSNVLGLSVTVLIAMPNAAKPTSSHGEGMHGKGKSVSRPNLSTPSFSANTHLMPAHIPAQGVASTSSPRHSMTVGEVEELHEKEELPEMVMGIVELPFRRPVEPSLSEENVEGAGVDRGEEQRSVT